MLVEVEVEIVHLLHPQEVLVVEQTVLQDHQELLLMLELQIKVVVVQVQVERHQIQQVD
jgi:hypothetical protein